MTFLPSLPRVPRPRSWATSRPTSTPPADRADARSAAGLSLLVLVLGLGLTATAVTGARSALQAETQARFLTQVDRLQTGLHRQVALAEDLLKGTRATFGISGRLTQDQFRAYASNRDLGALFPGVRGLGVLDAEPALVAPSDDLSGRRVAAADRPHAVARPAAASLRITHFAEPAHGSGWAPAQALGADWARLALAQQAVATGRAVLSGPVSMGLEGGRKAWLLMVPAHDAAGAQGVEAPARLFFAALSIREVMEPLRDGMGRGLQFQLFDGDEGRPQSLLYDSRAMPGASLAYAPLPRGRFASEEQLVVGDRPLTLRVVSTPALQLAPGQTLPWVIGVSGGLLSALLALASWLLMSAKDRARRMASGMTGDLQRMARVVERTSSAVFGMDLDGRITWANAGFERLTGLAADECVGRFAGELPEIAGVEPASRALLRAAVAKREVRRLELLNQMREGVRYWTDTELQPTRDNEGHVNGFICIASDITRRKLAELRLRDSEHLMRVIADNLPARVSYWDRERRCRFVNRRFCDVFHREPGQLKGQLLSPDIFGQAFYDQLSPHVDEVLQGRPQYFEYEADEGAGRTSSWQLHYIPDIEADEVRGFFVLALDVTQLRQARDLAVQASQSKSRFLSSMSHEIRTPLNAVLGMLALLRGTTLDGRQRDYADKADRAARSLLTLLNDILDLSKIEAGKMALAPRAFAVDDLLRDLSVIFAASVGRKELEVLFDIDPALPPRLVADDLRLRQVLINLGGNAIKFTERGEVVLALRLLGGDRERARVEVSVRDTGIGIAPQEQERIFSEFGQASDTTARQFGGTGLGLGICQKLLGLMGSQLRLESEAGRGSRFWFELDLPVAPADAAPAPAPAKASGPRRVLIVDDNSDARESLAAMARGLGWTVDVADSGAAAVAMVDAAAPGQAYDAVFVDWRMPDMDGWQASLRIRQLPAAAKAPLVIMVTAYGREMLSQRPPDEQALLDGFLVKPVTPTMLADALAPAAPPQAMRGAVGPGLPLAGLRLLLVEDNPTNQQVAMELLAAQGAQVELASNGRDGLERIRDAAHQFDAVLMDVLMPVMDGLTAARAVREQLGNWRLPIIAMTANAMESDRMDSLAAGMNDHVGKPFSIEQLVQVLLHHVGQRGAAAPMAAPAAAVTMPPLPEAASQGAGLPASEPPQALSQRTASHPDNPKQPAHGQADPEHTARPLASQLLDRGSAVSRLGGDRALYDRLVPSFTESLQGIASRLPTLLNSVPQAEAVRMMHTLKGSAATMGADRLSAAAASAERVLAGPQAQGEPSEALHAVAAAIEDTLGALAGD
ncbi:response regulator [Ramlibacter sp. AN1015]|uniref:response regulator n=1 Tax=Ramlibacter sp. AN1015 TaxID=3133428 RepID=UPI0030C1E778